MTVRHCKALPLQVQMTSVSSQNSSTMIVLLVKAQAPKIHKDW